MENDQQRQSLAERLAAQEHRLDGLRRELDSLSHELADLRAQISDPAIQETSPELSRSTSEVPRLDELPPRVKTSISDEETVIERLEAPPPPTPIDEMPTVFESVPSSAPTVPESLTQLKDKTADSPFLSEAEYLGVPEKRMEDVDDEEAVGWEVRLATTWLPRIGGVLLLIGAAFGASLILPHLGPGARVFLGYLLSAVIAGTGALVSKRHLQLGRVTVAIAVALCYFVSYASHFIPPMRVFEGAMAAVLLMAVFAGVLVHLAARWRSESFAVMGFGSGMLAVLCSAPSSQLFGLVGLVILSIGAGIVLVRNEWKRLTVFVVVGVYASSFLLFLLAPAPETSAELLQHLAALACYHLVFAAAFWRWSRPWMAREMMAEFPDPDDPAPRIDVGTLSLASAFAIMNSLGLVALSTWFLWSSGLLWSEVEILLFCLAGAEAARLIIPTLSRGSLKSFHAIMASALFGAGLIAAFDGPVESGLLAAQTVILAIAASRARGLRILRPLSFVAAALAVKDFAVPAIMAPPEIAAALLPGVFLLLSALPWENIWTRQPRPFASGVLLWFEAVSGQLRAATGAALIIATCAAIVRLSGNLQVVMLLPALIIAAAIPLLGAVAWLLAFLAAFIAPIIMMHLSPEEISSSYRIAGFLWAIALVYTWQEIRRMIRSPVIQLLLLLLFISVAMGLLAHLRMISAVLEPHAGLACLIMAGLISLLAYCATRIPHLPAFVPPPEGLTDGASDDPATQVPAFTPVPPAYMAGAAVGAGAIYDIVVKDAAVSILSPVIAFVALGGCWLVWATGSGRHVIARNAFYFGALIALAGGIVVRLDYAMAGLALAGIVALIMLVMASRLREGIAAWGAVAALMLLAVYGLGVEKGPANWIGIPREVFGAFLGVILLPAALVIEFTWRRTGDVDEESSFRAAFPPAQTGIVLTGLSAVLVLFFLAAGDTISDKLVTLCWGVTGAAFLALGFLFLYLPLRQVAIGVFALAVGRIFFHDLTGAPMATKAIAFIGVGILLVGSALAYGFLSGRLNAANRSKQDAPPPGPSPE